MTSDERDRDDLRRRLAELIGEEHADRLMEHIPPFPWDELATKSDLARLEADFGGRMDRLDSRMDGLDSRMDGLDSRMDGLDSRMDGLDGHMRELEHGLIRVDERINGLDGKIDLLTGEMRSLASNVHDLGMNMVQQSRMYLLAFLGAFVTICASLLAAVKIT